MLNLQTHSIVVGAVSFERARQDKLKQQGKFNWTPDEVDPIRGVTMLAEECGEVAQAALAVIGDAPDTLTEQDLYAECIHVAAVAVAMAEGILNRKVEYNTPRSTSPLPPQA